MTRTMNCWRAVGVLMAMIAAACGSTTSVAERNADVAVTPEGLRVADIEREIASDPGAIGATSGSPGQTPSAEAGRGPSANLSSPGAIVTGVDEPGRPAGGGPVKIGVLYLASQCDYYATAGADELGCLDERASYEAVIDAVNASGGLAGRPLEPVWYEAANQSDTTYQAGCAHLTQDNTVVAVLTGTAAGRSQVLRGCVAAAGVPMFDADSTTTATAETYEEQPMYITPVGPSLDRFARLYADGLLESGFLAGRWNAHGSCSTETKPKLGLLSFDLPEYRDVYERVLGPRFAENGHPIEEVSYVAYTQDLGVAARDAQAAVLRFASECVDHVVFLDTGAPAMLFANGASTQGYTPRYGFGSPSIPSVVFSLYTNPRVQLRGAVGVGWCPICDLAQTDWDPVAQRPGAARCDKLLDAARAEKNGPAGEFYALRVCDAVYFLQAAAAASPALTPVGLVEGAKRVGTAYDPAVTYRTSMSPSQRDGAAGYRTFEFVDDCTCYRYTSEIRPF